MIFLSNYYIIMNGSWMRFMQIMLFYVILSYLIMPVLFYYIFGRTLMSAGNGFVVGSVLSIILWYGYGSKMV